MIKVKKGASITGCRAEILEALIDINPIYEKHGVDTVVTSGCEKYKHNAVRSAHYRGDGIDLRIKNILAIKRQNVVAAIKRKLGPDFVVLHEGKGKPWEHIHVHWSPVYHPGV
jgi:hypothetical protein